MTIYQARDLTTGKLIGPVYRSEGEVRRWAENNVRTEHRIEIEMRDNKKIA